MNIKMMCGDDVPAGYVRAGARTRRRSRPGGRLAELLRRPELAAAEAAEAAALVRADGAVAVTRELAEAAAGARALANLAGFTDR